MTEEVEDHHHHHRGPVEEHPSPLKDSLSIRLSIWPPSHTTRDAVINHLVHILSTPSVISKRYGTLLNNEAAAAAHAIEEAAFLASCEDAETTDEQIEVLKIYSKEVSRRMLESAKARVSPTAPSAPATEEDLPVES